MVELVDTTDSKSVAERRGGSSPPTGTNLKSPVTMLRGFFISKINDFLQISVRARNPANPPHLESALNVLPH